MPMLTRPKDQIILSIWHKTSSISEKMSTSIIRESAFCHFFKRNFRTLLEAYSDPLCLYEIRAVTELNKDACYAALCSESFRISFAFRHNRNARAAD